MRWRKHAIAGGVTVARLSPQRSTEATRSKTDRRARRGHAKVLNSGHAPLKATGSTQSQVAERLIERALHYDRMLSAMNTTMDEIRRGNLEAAFRAEGYSPIHSIHGKIWVPARLPHRAQRLLSGERT